MRWYARITPTGRNPTFRYAAMAAVVVRGRVDGQAVMAPNVDEIASQGRDRVRPQTLALDIGRQEQVDAGMAELGLLLLVGLDEAHDATIPLDDVVPLALDVIDEDRRRTRGASYDGHQWATEASARISASAGTSSSSSVAAAPGDPATARRLAGTSSSCAPRDSRRLGRLRVAAHDPHVDGGGSRGPASAACCSGAHMSASRSIQNTYSQVCVRLGRDSSLVMFRSCSASTLSTRTRVPGSLRTETSSVECIADDWAAAAAGPRAPGGASTRKRVRLRGSDWMSAASTSRPNSDAARGESTAAEPVSSRSAIILPAPAVLVAASRLQSRRAQERLGLAERLDVRVDPLDVLETLSRQGREAQPDRAR